MLHLTSRDLTGPMTRCMDAIEPFVAQALELPADASPTALCNIIHAATGQEHVYSFMRLLNVPVVQWLRERADATAEQRAYVDLLEVFAFGTLDDYHATPGLPVLYDKQLKKLRLLSLLTLARRHVPLRYEVAMDCLRLDTAAELEQVAIDAMHRGLITGRLASAATPPTFDITHVLPIRDARPEDCAQKVAEMTAWQDRCGVAMVQLREYLDRLLEIAEERQASSHAESERGREPRPGP
ncbi:hypothetical protein KEM52_004472 [Ascosphaera acerosa]|nr:hypothetical protein KEM52_004472 [Ascosphaera acerosa]